MPPTTDGHRVFLWWCGNVECELSSIDAAGQLSGAADVPDDTFRIGGTAAAAAEHVLILGGLSDPTGDPTSNATSALLYDVANDSWSELPHPEWFPAGTDHDVVWTGDRFLTWGGWRRPGADDARPHGELEVGALIDPVTGTWQDITASGRPDGQGPMIWTAHGLFLWVFSPDQVEPSAWLYSPDDDFWEELPLDSALTPRYATLAASTDAVYVIGGDPYEYGEYFRYNGTTRWFREVWEFRLSERTWTRLHLPSDAAVGGAAVFVADRLYLIDAACAPGSFYTPSTGVWGVTTWPENLERPQYLLEVEGKASIYGDSRHRGPIGSFFQYTP